MLKPPLKARFPPKAPWGACLWSVFFLKMDQFPDYFTPQGLAQRLKEIKAAEDKASAAKLREWIVEQVTDFLTDCHAPWILIELSPSYNEDVTRTVLGELMTRFEGRVGIFENFQFVPLTETSNVPNAVYLLRRSPEEASRKYREWQQIPPPL